MPKLNEDKAEVAALIGFILGAAQSLYDQFQRDQTFDIYSFSRLKGGIAKLDKKVFPQQEKRK